MDFKLTGYIHRYILLIWLIHENSISMFNHYVYPAFVDSNKMCIPQINHCFIPEITLKGAHKLALTFFSLFDRWIHNYVVYLVTPHFSSHKETLVTYTIQILI